MSQGLEIKLKSRTRLSCAVWFRYAQLAALGLGVCWSSVEAVADVEITEAKLGQQLFTDTAFSLNGNSGCASCHNPSAAFTDPRTIVAAGAVSVGDDMHSPGLRNAPTITYAATSPEFHFDEDLEEYVGGQFWDGRTANLAEQAKGPPLNTAEMMMPSADEVVTRISSNPQYESAFRQLYGENIFDAPANEIDESAAWIAFGKAIQAFEQTPALSTYDSKYDRFLRGDYDLTVLEDLGRTLFFSNDNVSCNTCHLLKNEDAPQEVFTNHQYRNIGVPPNPALLALEQTPEDYVDQGLVDNPAVSDLRWLGKFKTPTLRNVAVTGPYMHNGVFSDLRTVIEFYDKYNNTERTVNPETQAPWETAEVTTTIDNEDLSGAALTDRKIDALVAFMQALTDARYEHLIDSQE